MAKSKKSFADIIAQAQVMATGLKAQQTEMAKRGWQEVETSTIVQLREKVIALNDAQEKLKSELKTKTEALAGELEVLNGKLAEAKKLVKLVIPLSGWREFGIDDKR